MNSYVILTVCCLVQTTVAEFYELNDDDYELLPPVVSLDPWSSCLRHPSGRYCTAFHTYVADGASPLLNMMQKLSEHTSSRLNHTRAFYGTCVSQKCKNDDEYTTLDTRMYLERCLNRTLWEKYTLRVKVEDNVSCHKYGEKRSDAGALDIAVAGLLLALVLLNIVGSMCDIYCPKLWSDRLAGQLILCFSISHNWRKLTDPPVLPGSDLRLESLTGIHGIRAISMILVVLAHAFLPAILNPENPKFIEDLYDTLYFHVILNGTIIMQTFLFLSGFLLVFSHQVYAETHPVTWKTMPMAVLKRWLRLTPSYAIVLGVTMTWLQHISTGPLWDQIVVEESEACRRTWWQHIIYINNYVDSSRCMPQTWYLAVDTQLYCMGLAIFVFCQSSRRRKLVLSALFIVGLILPAFHTYLQDLNGPLLASPAAAMGQFRTDRTFNAVYKRGHTNLTSYILGMVAGCLVHSLQSNKFDINKYKAWRPLYWLLFPLGVVIPLCCKVFYSSPKVDILYRVLTAAFLKPAFGLVIGAIIVGMVFHLENVYRGILTWSGWVQLSRVSYSAYLLHIAYIRITLGSNHYPIRISYLRGAEMVAFTVMIVYIAAYFFWLTVEAPLANVVKICLHTNSGPEKIKDA